MKKILRIAALCMLSFLCISGVAYAGLGNSNRLKTTKGSGSIEMANPWGAAGYRFSIIYTTSPLPDGDVSSQLAELYKRYRYTYPGNTGVNINKGYYVLESTHNSSYYSLINDSGYNMVCGTNVGSGADIMPDYCSTLYDYKTLTRDTYSDEFKVSITATDTNEFNPLATKAAYEVWQKYNMKSSTDVYRWLKEVLGDEYYKTCKEVLRSLVNSKDLMKSVKYLDGSLSGDIELATYGADCMLAYVLGATKGTSFALSSIYDEAYAQGKQPIVIIDAVIAEQLVDYGGELNFPMSGDKANKSLDPLGGAFYRIVSFKDFMNYFFGFDGNEYWMSFYDTDGSSLLSTYRSNSTLEKNGVNDYTHIDDTGSIFTLASYVHDALVTKYCKPGTGVALNCDLAQSVNTNSNASNPTTCNYSNTVYWMLGQHQGYSTDECQMRFVIVDRNDQDKVFTTTGDDYSQTSLRWFRRSDSITGRANTFMTLDFTDESMTSTGHYGFALVGAARRSIRTDIPREENWIWDDTKTEKLQSKTIEVASQKIDKQEIILRVGLTDVADKCPTFDTIRQGMQDAGANGVQFKLSVSKTVNGGTDAGSDIVWQYNNHLTNLKTTDESVTYTGDYYTQMLDAMFTRSSEDVNTFYIKHVVSGTMTGDTYTIEYTPKLTITYLKDGNVINSAACVITEYDTIKVIFKYKEFTGTVTWKQKKHGSINVTGPIPKDTNMSLVDIKLHSTLSDKEWTEWLRLAGPSETVPVTFNYYIQAAAGVNKNVAIAHYLPVTTIFNKYYLESSLSFEQYHSDCKTVDGHTVLSFTVPGKIARELLIGQAEPLSLLAKAKRNLIAPLYLEYVIRSVEVTCGENKAVFSPKSQTYVQFSSSGDLDGSLSFKLDPSGVQQSETAQVNETVKLKKIQFKTNERETWYEAINTSSSIQVKLKFQKVHMSNVAAADVASVGDNAEVRVYTSTPVFKSGPFDCKDTFTTITKQQALAIIDGTTKWTYTDDITGDACTVTAYAVDITFRINNKYVGSYKTDQQWVGFTTKTTPAASYTWALSPAGNNKVVSDQPITQKIETITLTGDSTEWQQYLDTCNSYKMKITLRRQSLDDLEAGEGIDGINFTNISMQYLTSYQIRSSTSNNTYRTGTAFSLTKQQLLDVLTGNITFDIAFTITDPKLDMVAKYYVDVLIITDKDTIPITDNTSPLWVRYQQTTTTEWRTDLADTAAHAFAELKQGTIYNEQYEAMAGVPTTESLYFGSGGKEFMALISYEYVTDATATRSYQMSFTSHACCAHEIMNTYLECRLGAQDAASNSGQPTAVTYTCDGGNMESTTGCTHSHTENWVSVRDEATRWNWAIEATDSTYSGGCGALIEAGIPAEYDDDGNLIAGTGTEDKYCDSGSTGSASDSASDLASAPGGSVSATSTCDCGACTHATTETSWHTTSECRWNWHWQQMQGDCSVSDHIYWTQDVTNISYIKITKLQIYQLSCAYVTGMEEISGTIDTYYDKIDVSNYAYNIANADTAKQGRLVYSYQGSALDSYTFPSVVSSNHPDSYKSDNVKQLEDLYHVTTTYNNPTIISDWAILRTASGDMSLCYHEQSFTNTRVPLAVIDISSADVYADPIKMPDITKQQMIDVNGLTTEGAHIPTTGIGTVGYNGDYASPYTKYTPSHSYPTVNMSLYKINSAEYYSESAYYKSYLAAYPYTGSGLSHAGIPIANIRNGTYTPTKAGICYRCAVCYNSTPMCQLSYNSYVGENVYTLPAVYKTGDNNINSILIHDPVSVQGAVLLPNATVGDQRVNAGLFPLPTYDTTCPHDATCTYATLKSTNTGCDLHCDYSGTLYCTDDCYSLTYVYNRLYDASTGTTTVTRIPKYTRNCCETHHVANTNYKYYISGMILDDGSYCDPTDSSFATYTGKIKLDSGCYLDASKRNEWLILFVNGEYLITQCISKKDGLYFCSATGTYVKPVSYDSATSYDHNYHNIDKRRSTNVADHYAHGTDTCWVACNNDANHAATQTVTGTVQATQSADMVILDSTLTLYFPSVGNFYGNDALGIPEVSNIPGHGYTNAMDVSKWTKRKYCVFKDIDVMYNGVYYYAGQLIELVPVNATSYVMHVPLKNNEYSATKVTCYAVADNAETDDWVENMTSVNRERYGTYLAAYHDAMKELFFDVVGRVGSLTMVDTGDWRYSDFFKQGLSTWFVKNIMPNVDVTKQNFYLADTCDIMGQTIMTDSMADRYGTTPWRTFEKLKPLPLLPTSNCVNRLACGLRRRVGYPLYLTVDTIGCYYGDNNDSANALSLLSIHPYFYAVNLNTKRITPVDIYIKSGSGYRRIYAFNHTTTEYKYAEYFDYEKDADRYNIGASSDVNAISASVATAYNSVLPQGDARQIGTLQNLYLTARQRMYVGSDYTEGIFRSDSTVLFDSDTSTTVDMRLRNLPAFKHNAQRWYFTLALPSSSVFVAADSLPTDENIAMYSDKNIVIMTALDILAKGSVWTLRYSQPVSNITINGVSIDTTVVGNKAIVDVMESNQSSAIDLDMTGTH